MGFWTVVLIGIAVIVVLRYVIVIKRSDGTVLFGAEAPTRQAPAIAFDWPALGDYDFEVVGESHYQGALQSLAGDHGNRSPDKECQAVIIPEDNNRYDKNAIRIDIDGRTIGYLSRDDAPRFRRRLGAKKIGIQPTRCNAMIVGGYLKKSGERTSYGVRLDIKPFD